MVGVEANGEALVLPGPPATLGRIRLAAGDRTAAGRIAALDYQPGETFAVRDVVLAPIAPDP